MTSTVQFIARFRLASGFALVVVTLSVEAAPRTGKSRLSPEIKSAVTGVLPKFSPQPMRPAKRSEPVVSRREPVDSDVFVLPDMVVEEKILQTHEVLTLKGKTDQYMNQYLGSKTGVDRGLLNKKTLNKGDGAVSYSLLGAEKNETRALEARFDDQRLRQRDDLLATVDALAIAGDPEKAAWLRGQSNHLFTRQPDIRRRK